MRFMMIYKPADTKDMEAGVPPTQDEIVKMGTFIDEMAKSGVLLATDGLQPSSKGARVRLSGGKLTVTDGPFTETKELIAGFAIVQVKSKREAIELAFFEHLSHHEIAARLGQPLGTVKARIRRGLLKLRQRLNTL